MAAISMAPIIVEKIAKKARSLSAVRLPGTNGTIRFLETPREAIPEEGRPCSRNAWHSPAARHE